MSRAVPMPMRYGVALLWEAEYTRRNMGLWWMSFRKLRAGRAMDQINENTAFGDLNVRKKSVLVMRV